MTIQSGQKIVIKSVRGKDGKMEEKKYVVKSESGGKTTLMSYNEKKHGKIIGL